MYDWTVLNQTVSHSLAGGTVGTPVFVRWTAAAAQNTPDLKPLLAAMSACAESWLSARPRRVYATGSADAGHLSLSLEYDNGQSALLAISLANDHPAMNLIILGAHGAIYHTDFEGNGACRESGLWHGRKPPTHCRSVNLANGGRNR